ncbi:MAG: YgfZ/GcvT domain-containing protein [Myxococcota bacterium]
MSAAEAAETAARVRRGVGWFPELARGVVSVAGADRTRWLNGMISADVAALAPGEGAPALLLSPKGRILADMHVLNRGDVFWLDTAQGRVDPLVAALDRYVIADDVTLANVSPDLCRASLEGPRLPDVLRALGVAAPPPDGCVEALVGGAPVVLAAFGESGEPALQLFVPVVAFDAVADAVVAASGDALVAGDAATLDVLRIEAGTPRIGADLDDDVFPAEAGLVERAVSLTKGCFTGQEIVARIESRGGVNHRLVGLHFGDAAPPEPGRALALPEGKAIGEVTSACVSPVGAIGLGYVRLPHDAPGTELRVGEQVARVTALPFVHPTPP